MRDILKNNLTGLEPGKKTLMEQMKIALSILIFLTILLCLQITKTRFYRYPFPSRTLRNNGL